MKKVLLFTAALISLTQFAAATITMEGDTTILFNNKRIKVSETTDRVKVKVYELTNSGDSVESEKVFEGIYKDGRSYETRRNTKSFTISVPSWNRDYDPHWAGFGVGFANFSDASLSLNDVDGISLNSGKSLDYNLNVFEKAYPISRNGWAVVTGLGMRWTRYRLDKNEYFKEIDGVTALLPAPEGVTYKSSKLGTTHITIPLLLEWQNPHRKSELFFSAGLVGAIKTWSSSKVVYRDSDGDKHKQKMDSGMNIRPFNIDVLIQGGLDNVGFYARYSPMTMFEKNKGPELHPVSIGLQFHF